MRRLLVILIAAVAILAPMQAAEASAKYAVSSTVSTSSIELGKSFVLSGTVSPSAKGKTVKIQRQYAGGAWSTILTKTLSSKSKYSATIKPSKAGPTNYRVIKVKSGSRAQGVTSARTVNIFRWRYMLDLPNTRTPSTVYDGTASVAGSAFGRSLSIKAGELVDWDLASKRCDKLRAYVGIDDDSQAGTTGEAYVADGTPGAGALLSDEWGIQRGQSARYVQLGLGAFTKIRFFAELSNINSWMLYGTPQVHCNS